MARTFETLKYGTCLLDYEIHGIQKITCYLWTSFCKPANKCYLSDIKNRGKYHVSSILISFFPHLGHTDKALHIISIAGVHILHLVM